MRVAGLHITETYLHHIIDEWKKTTQDDSTQSLVEYIMIYGKKYTLTHRKKLERYDKRAQRAKDQLPASSTEAAKTFAGLLKNIREHELKHKGITTIREGTKDWGAIKECAGKASAFGIVFNLTQREAFIEYIRTYFTCNGNVHGRFNISGMSSKHELICSAFESRRAIENDATPEATRKAHLSYSQQVSEKTGIVINYEQEPLKYVFFVYAKEIAKKFGLTPQQYITAQFQTLDWTNGIPAPNQLVTKNAEERTVKWMAEHGIKKEIKRDPKQSKDFWAKIRQDANRIEQQQE